MKRTKGYNRFTITFGRKAVSRDFTTGKKAISEANKLKNLFPYIEQGGNIKVKKIRINPRGRSFKEGIYRKIRDN